MKTDKSKLVIQYSNWKRYHSIRNPSLTDPDKIMVFMQLLTTQDLGSFEWSGPDQFTIKIKVVPLSVEYWTFDKYNIMSMLNCVLCINYRLRWSDCQKTSCHLKFIQLGLLIFYKREALFFYKIRRWYPICNNIMTLFISTRCLKDEVKHHSGICVCVLHHLVKSIQTKHVSSTS